MYKFHLWIFVIDLGQLKKAQKIEVQIQLEFPKSLRIIIYQNIDPHVENILSEIDELQGKKNTRKIYIEAGKNIPWSSWIIKNQLT